MTSNEYASLIANSLASPALHKDELCFLHALHLRLVAHREKAQVTGSERTRVLAILSAQRLSQTLPELAG
jgi:hypothetical protein